MLHMDTFVLYLVYRKNLIKVLLSLMVKSFDIHLMCRLFSFSMCCLVYTLVVFGSWIG